MYVKLITATQVFKRNLKKLLCVCVLYVCVCISIYEYIATFVSPKSYADLLGNNSFRAMTIAYKWYTFL